MTVDSSAASTTKVACVAARELDSSALASSRLEGSAASRLISAFLAARSPSTLRAYREDLERLRTFVGAPTLDSAAALLLDRGLGAANELVLAWRNDMVRRGFAPTTVNRRLSAVRSLVRLARTLGMVPWSLEIPGVRSTPYRDTRGPGREGVAALLNGIEAEASPRFARDRAIVRLLYDLALRRAEVAALDVEHVDLAQERLTIVGKGRTEQETVPLPEATRDALRAWLAARPGRAAGPLFLALDRPGRTGRLSPISIYRLVRGWGERVGVRARPHGLRHASITEALERTGGNVRKVARFARHRDVRHTQIYDDARADHAGEIARIVSESI